MDQPARRVAYGSLNSECRCLKLVDTFRYGETDSFGGNILTECYWISLRIIRTISYREECRRFRWADSSRKSSSLQPRAFS